ncbi:MAG: PQQ-binding-like beta-propeller repeat protein [Akkermansiaceae bacterium]
MLKKIVISTFTLGLMGLSLHAQWPDWRGPNGTGAVAEGKLPMEFSADGKGVVWKTELPGRACSTPVVSRGMLYLTSPVDGKDALIAYDLKGREMWRQTYGQQTPGRGQRVGSGANSSPVTDGETVVGYFKSGRVVACSSQGEKLWDKDLHKLYGEDNLWWDQGTSPLLCQGSVIIAVMQTEGDSYLVSFDLKSGKENWKTERKFKTAKESGDSYTSPHLVEIKGIKTVVSFGADHITGHNAENGEQIWFSGGINPEGKGMWRSIASSVITDGVVVVPHGRGEYLMGIKLGGEGDVTKSNVLWRKKIATTDAASLVGHDGLIYQIVDRGKSRGMVTCINAKSGEKVWEDKLPKSASTYYASPILVGDQLCVPREDGVVFLAKVTQKGLGEIKKNTLGEALIASPIFVEGKLILRGAKHLWALQ